MLREGVLRKRSRLGRWQQRHFLLTNRHLQYYDIEEGNALRGVLNLGEIDSVKSLETQPEVLVLRLKEHEDGHAEMQLKCSTPADAREWTTSVADALQSCPQQDAMRKHVSDDGKMLLKESMEPGVHLDKVFSRSSMSLGVTLPSVKAFISQHASKRTLLQPGTMYDDKGDKVSDGCMIRVTAGQHMKQVGVVVRCVTFPDLYEVQLLGEDENDEVEDGAEEKVVLHRDSMEYHYALDHPDATVDQLRDLIKTLTVDTGASMVEVMKQSDHAVDINGRSSSTKLASEKPKMSKRSSMRSSVSTVLARSLSITRRGSLFATNTDDFSRGVLGHGASGVGTADVFVSFTQSYKLSRVIGALDNYLDQEGLDRAKNVAGSRRRKQSFPGVRDRRNQTFFFIDIFVIRQYKNGNIFCCDLDDVSNIADLIGKIGRTVVVVDPWFKPAVFSRGWCLFEIVESLQRCNGAAGLKMVLCKQEEENLIQALLGHGLSTGTTTQPGKGSPRNHKRKDIFKMSKINVMAAKCFREEDWTQIKRQIEASYGLKKMNEMVVRFLNAWIADQGRKALERDPFNCSLLIEVTRILTSLGKMDRALPVARQAVIECVKQLGKDDPQTLRVSSSLCWALLHLGLHEEALPRCRDVSDRVVTLLGEAHHFTHRAHAILAWGLLEEGMLDEALTLSESTKQALEQTVGKAHYNTRSATLIFSWTLLELEIRNIQKLPPVGRPPSMADTAIALAQEAIIGLEAVVGAYHFLVRWGVTMLKKRLHRLQAAQDADAAIPREASGLQQPAGSPPSEPSANVPSLHPTLGKLLSRDRTLTVNTTKI